MLSKGSGGLPARLQPQSDASAVLGDELQPGTLESLDHGAVVHGGEPAPRFAIRTSSPRANELGVEYHAGRSDERSDAVDDKAVQQGRTSACIGQGAGYRCCHQQARTTLRMLPKRFRNSQL